MRILRVMAACVLGTAISLLCVGALEFCAKHPVGHRRELKVHRAMVDLGQDAFTVPFPVMIDPKAITPRGERIVYALHEDGRGVLGNSDKATVDIRISPKDDTVFYALYPVDREAEFAWRVRDLVESRPAR